MQTEAEVLTDHNELICSTSIERIVTGRNAALSLIEILIHKLDDISRLTSSIGGDVAEHWAMR
ncbi:restriction endonuclease subunit M, partial [Salmonella enterica subsp. enterica]|nr:restriction endonuclease subunit M [Salmonella enterica subsp. enterica]